MSYSILLKRSISYHVPLTFLQYFAQQFTKFTNFWKRLAPNSLLTLMQSKVLSIWPYYIYNVLFMTSASPRICCTHSFFSVYLVVSWNLISSPPASPVLNAQWHYSPPLASLLQEQNYLLTIQHHSYKCCYWDGMQWDCYLASTCLSSYWNTSFLYPFWNVWESDTLIRPRSPSNMLKHYSNNTVFSVPAFICRGSISRNWMRKRVKNNIGLKSQIHSQFHRWCVYSSWETVVCFLIISNRISLVSED